MEYINIYYLIQNGELYSNDYDISNHMYATQKDVEYIDNICRHFLIIMLEHHLAIVSILIQANGSQEMELFH